MNNPELTVIISLDVEEEGLFSGSYKALNCGVDNIALLRKLAPLTHELGYPLTLFCAHTVFANHDACEHLAYMRDKCQAEIALHLHHWSTPPILEVSAQGKPTPSDKMSRELLFEKLQNLVCVGQRFQGAPLTSFRMGRWDFKNCLRPLLTDLGITVDSSVCPLRSYPGGPDFFQAPPDPYWADTKIPLLVVPITQIPVMPVLDRIWYGLWRKRQSLLDTFHFWNVASANPVWHRECIMRFAARTHARRGGKVLSLFWHSSEMLPGGSPNVPNVRAATALLQKIYDFLSWLNDHFDVKPMTAAQYYAAQYKVKNNVSSHRAPQYGDW